MVRVCLIMIMLIVLLIVFSLAKASSKADRDIENIKITEYSESEKSYSENDEK